MSEIELLENPDAYVHSPNLALAARAAADPGLRKEIWVPLLSRDLAAWANPLLDLYMLENGGPPECWLKMYGRIFDAQYTEPTTPAARGASKLVGLAQQRWEAASTVEELLAEAWTFATKLRDRVRIQPLYRLSEVLLLCYPCQDEELKNETISEAYTAASDLIDWYLCPQRDQRRTFRLESRMESAALALSTWTVRGAPFHDHPRVAALQALCSALPLRQYQLVGNGGNWMPAMLLHLRRCTPDRDPLQVLRTFCPTPGHLFTMDHLTAWRHLVE